MRDRLQTRVRAAVAEVVRKQIDAGVDIVNDGERASPRTPPTSKIGSPDLMAKRMSMAIADLADFPNSVSASRARASLETLKRPACTAPISYEDLDAVNRDIAESQSRGSRSQADRGVSNRGLARRHFDLSRQSLLQELTRLTWRALADAMKAEYNAIHQAGLHAPGRLSRPRDGPSYPVPGRDRSGVPQEPRDARRSAQSCARRNSPKTASRFICAGETTKARIIATYRLRDIIDIVFKVRAQRNLVRGANPRHEHEWAVFKDVKLPAGKVLMPGVIDSTNNYIEHPELVAQRITNIAGVVGRENVIAGSDCGFATVAGYTPVDPKITWAKLAAMSEGARIASARLW